LAIVHGVNVDHIDLSWLLGQHEPPARALFLPEIGRDELFRFFTLLGEALGELEQVLATGDGPVWLDEGRRPDHLAAVR
jgi:hypothetical protein